MCMRAYGCMYACVHARVDDYSVGRVTGQFTMLLDANSIQRESIISTPDAQEQAR